jgi:hypothetical protein
MSDYTINPTYVLILVSALKHECYVNKMCIFVTYVFKNHVYVYLLLLFV